MKRFKKLQFYGERFDHGDDFYCNFIFKIVSPTINFNWNCADWIDKKDSLKLLQAIRNGSSFAISDGGNSYSMIEVKNGYVQFYTNVGGSGGDCVSKMTLKCVDCVDAFRDFYNFFE